MPNRKLQNPLLLPAEKLVADIFELCLYAMQQSCSVLDNMSKVLDYQLLLSINCEVEALKYTIPRGVLSQWQEVSKEELNKALQKICAKIKRLEACAAKDKNAFFVANCLCLKEFAEELETLVSLAENSNEESDVAALLENIRRFLDEQTPLFSALKPFCYGDFIHFESVQVKWFLEGIKKLELLSKWMCAPADKRNFKRDIQSEPVLIADTLYEEHLNNSFYISDTDALCLYGLPFALRLDFYVSDFRSKVAATVHFDRIENAAVFSYYGLAENLFLKNMSRPSDTSLKKIYMTVLHECVHIMQLCLSRDFECAGLDFKRGEKYRDYYKAAEQLMKKEYEEAGIDPNIVNFHTLDDIEFYTLLLEDVVEFIDLWSNNASYSYDRDSPNLKMSLDACITKYIDSNRHFITWKYIEYELKYLRAVEEFKEAVMYRQEELKASYVDFIENFAALKKTSHGD